MKYENMQMVRLVIDKKKTITKGTKQKHKAPSKQSTLAITGCLFCGSVEGNLRKVEARSN